MSTANNKRLSIFIFIDALGWEVVKDGSFLNQHLTTKRPLNTIFGYSSTCQPSILTGSLPREHGHFTFFTYNPKKSPFRWFDLIRFIPNFITSKTKIRNILSKVTKYILGYTGYFQLYQMPFKFLPFFDYTEKKDIFRKNGINNGQNTIFDTLRELKIKYHCSEWSQAEDENLKSIQTDIKKGMINFSYLYLPDLDGLLHQYGTESKFIQDKLSWYEKKLSELIKVAKHNYSEVRIHAFSDHGMTNIKESYDLKSKIEVLNYKYGQDYVVIYDSTMARFWFFNEKVREDMTALLYNLNKGRVLEAEELEGYGCDFEDHQYGQLIFLMNPGTLLCPSFMGLKPLKGMHGFAPDHKDSVAFYGSNASSDVLPKRLEDIYSLMLSDAKWSSFYDEGKKY